MKANIASLSKNCIRATARGERRSDKFLPFRAAPGAEKRCGLVFWTGERSAKNRTFQWNKASNPFNFGTGNIIPSDGHAKLGLAGGGQAILTAVWVNLMRKDYSTGNQRWK